MQLLWRLILKKLILDIPHDNIYRGKIISMQLLWQIFFKIIVILSYMSRIIPGRTHINVVIVSKLLQEKVILKYMQGFTLEIKHTYVNIATGIVSMILYMYVKMTLYMYVKMTINLKNLCHHSCIENDISPVCVVMWYFKYQFLK